MRYPRIPGIRIAYFSTVEENVSFANQVAVITGASSGIGWELAKTLPPSSAPSASSLAGKDRLEALVA